MATVRKYWRCTHKDCKNDKGRQRGYKKVHLGEKSASCKHCGRPMELSGNYSTRITRDGKTTTTSVSPRKVDAEAHLAACVVAKKSGALFPGEETMISWKSAKETFAKWIASEEDNGQLSPRTGQYYKDGLKPLEPYFRNEYLQEIGKQAIEDFKTARAKSVSKSTVNMSLAALKRLYAVIIDQLPARSYPRLHEAKTDVFKVSLLKLDNHNEIILETEEEVNALLAECTSPHLYHFVYGVLNTGLRHGDMLSLKNSEIFFSHNEIVKVVKGQKKVHIPLTPQYRAYLEEWLKSQKVKSINHYVIPSRLDPASCYRVDSNIGFETACENAAKKFDQAKNKKLAAKFRHLKPHHLRHTFATHFLYKTSKMHGATVAVHILSKILGHSSTYITERYSHALKDVNQSSMEVFGNGMFGQSL